MSFHSAEITRQHLKFILLIVAAVMLVYSNSLGNGFILDDYPHIIENVFITQWNSILHVFTTDLFHFSPQITNFYRPLQVLSYMLDYSFWQYNAFGYHLTNMLLHLFNSILVYMLIWMMSKNKKLSFMTGLLFAVHPIHTQAVTYISGRADPMAAFFMLTGLIAYIRSRDIRERSKEKTFFNVISIVCFVCALLSKEISLIFPFLLMLYEYCFPQEKKETRRFPGYFLFFLFLGGYLYLRLSFLWFTGPDASTHGEGLSLRLLTVPKIIISYIWLLIFPVKLHIDRYVPWVESFLCVEVIIPGLILCVIGAAVAALRQYSKLLFFFTLWFFLLLFPTLNIIPVNAAQAEHWLYLPSVGFFVIIAFFIDKSIKSKRYVFRGGAVLLLTAFLLSLSIATIRRNSDWSNEIEFYKKTIEYSGQWNIDRTNCNLALAYYRDGQYDKAMEQAKETLKINPDYPEALCLIGVLYGTNKEYDKSIEALKKAIEVLPGYVKAYNNLGITYAKKGELVQAIEVWKKIIEYDPDYVPAEINIIKAKKMLKNQE
ncbi:MAG: tetratricopeptide repeat protein [Candidatus Omnitrophota bacterium]